MTLNLPPRKPTAWKLSCARQRPAATRNVLATPAANTNTAASTSRWQLDFLICANLCPSVSKLLEKHRLCPSTRTKGGIHTRPHILLAARRFIDRLHIEALRQHLAAVANEVSDELLRVPRRNLNTILAAAHLHIGKHHARTGVKIAF